MQSIFSPSALPRAEALPGAGSDGGHVLTQEALAQGHVWLLDSAAELTMGCSCPSSCIPLLLS